MIKATCIPCGAHLGSFRDREEYLAWRSQTGGCPNCGASLDTSLFTSYVTGEHPVGEQPMVEEAREGAEKTGEAETEADTEEAKVETTETNNTLRNFLRRGR